MYPSKGFFRNVFFQPYNDVGAVKLQRSAKDSKHLVQRLGLEKRLDLHNGPVNSLQWNATGNLLLSAGDDKKIVITNPFTYDVHVDFLTQHKTNIFCAKFLPLADSRIISCSANGSILNLDLERPEETEGNFFHCHQCTCYELETVSDEPYTFFSCSEDATVRQYDLRYSTKCSKRHCYEDVLIDCGKPVNAIAINSIRPHQLAIATSDSTVRIIDRRSMRKQDRTSKIVPLCAFTVPHLNHRSYRMTSLSFSPDGGDLLVNYSNDDIYLFSVDKDPSATTILNDFLKNPPKPPPYKRLRLRGDWSDTGPLSRPSTDSSARSRINSTVMERMSLMLMEIMNSRNTELRGPSSTIHNNETSSRFDDLDDDVDNDNIESSSDALIDVIAQASTSNNHNIESTSSNRTIRYNRRTRKKLMLKKLKLLSIFDDFIPIQSIKAHYKGHRNSRTLIKEATFWGNDFIMAGSDCGHLFVWDRYTHELVMLLEADSHVLNCVQPHPTRPLLATSGTDYNVKLWSPTQLDNKFSQSFANELIEINKVLTEEARDTITVPAMFVVRMIAYFTQTRREVPRSHQSRNELAYLLTQLPELLIFASREYDTAEGIDETLS